jgi:hypothetical protein
MSPSIHLRADHGEHGSYPWNKRSRQVMILRVSRYARNDKTGNGFSSVSSSGAGNRGDIPVLSQAGGATLPCLHSPFLTDLLVCHPRGHRSSLAL